MSRGNSNETAVVELHATGPYVLNSPDFSRIVPALCRMMKNDRTGKHRLYNVMDEVMGLGGSGQRLWPGSLRPVADTSRGGEKGFEAE